MTTQIDIQTKIAVAVEVLNTEKTKAEISREFNVSTRSVGRWADQFKSEAEQVLMDQQNESKEAAEIKSSISDKEAKILADYQEKKHQDLKAVDRRFKRGIPKKGQKSIRQTVLEILDARKAKGELIKENRKDMIEEIAQAIGHEELSRSAWYFAVYKKVLGGYQDQ